MNRSYSDVLSAVRPGTPRHHRSLSVLPLLSPPSGPEVDSFTRATGAGHVEVCEVSRSGKVNTLHVLNRGPRPVLIIDGQELTGAKQNRVLNTTVLVPAGGRLDVPVSCVEAGRWAYRGHKFCSAGRAMPASMRRSRSARVSRSLEITGVYDACQETTWIEVASLSQEWRVPSRTKCMTEVVDAYRDTLADYVNAITVEASQNGLAAFVNGCLIGIDLVGRPELYADLHREILWSYAAEALRCDRLGRNSHVRAPGFSPRETMTTIKTLTTVAPEEHPPPGLGRDYRAATNAIRANILAVDGALVHMSAFPA